MAERPNLTVNSKVKQFIKDNGELKCSAEAISALSVKVEGILLEAIELAKKDKRLTVKGRDII